MSLRRLTRGDALALAAGLALLFVLAADWYSSVEGDEARRIQRLAEPPDDAGAETLQLSRDQQEQASIAAEGEERNAWQADGEIDRVILLALLATSAAAIAAAAFRAAGRRWNPPRSPSALALALALAAGTLVLYRMVQEPGFDQGTTIRGGPFLAIAALGLLALGARMALRAEQDGTAWAAAGPDDSPEAESDADPASPAEGDLVRP